jgi:cytochrome c556
MRTVSFRWLAVGVIGLGLAWGVLLAEPPPDNPRKQAQAAILSLSEKLDAKDVSARAKYIVDQYDSCDISSVFRLKKGGGLGVGKAAEAANLDSIERQVNLLATRKTTTEANLEQYRDDYLRVAKVMQAMAELAPYRGAPFTRQDPDRVQAWEKVSAEFKQNTAAFRKAIEETDPKRVRTTALTLQGTCNACHVLRDS